MFDHVSQRLEHSERQQQISHYRGVDSISGCGRPMRGGIAQGESSRRRLANWWALLNPSSSGVRTITCVKKVLKHA